MYYLPENPKFSGPERMPRNRVQHQKGLSDDAFEERYPDEQACRKEWFAWGWPEGFKCPRCAATAYCEIRERQLLQCRVCRYQTSLIAAPSFRVPNCRCGCGSAPCICSPRARKACPTSSWAAGWGSRPMPPGGSSTS